MVPIWVTSEVPSGLTALEADMRVYIWCDGAAMPNPGPDGAGYVVAGGVHLLGSEPLGDATKNVAEYTAVRNALRAAADAGATSAHVRMDSRVVYGQLAGVLSADSRTSASSGLGRRWPGAQRPRGAGGVLRQLVGNSVPLPGNRSERHPPSSSLSRAVLSGLGRKFAATN
jgi:hypothetical protein